MDERSRIGMNRQKQFMLLVFISIVSFSLFLGTGCGQEKSCELPKIGCESTDDIDGIGGVGISIPGCGGCLSSGAGWRCDTFGLWSQSIKVVVGVSNREYIVADSKNKEDRADRDGGKKKETDTAILLGIDDQYYVDEGCGSCKKNKLHAVYGLAVCDSPTKWLISVGHAPKGELYVGCGSGCADIGACGSEEPGRILLDILEHALDVE